MKIKVAFIITAAIIVMMCGCSNNGNIKVEEAAPVIKVINTPYPTDTPYENDIEGVQFNYNTPSPNVIKPYIPTQNCTVYDLDGETPEPTIVVAETTDMENVVQSPEPTPATELTVAETPNVETAISVINSANQLAYSEVTIGSLGVLTGNKEENLGLTKQDYFDMLKERLQSLQIVSNGLVMYWATNTELMSSWSVVYGEMESIRQLTAGVSNVEDMSEYFKQMNYDKIHSESLNFYNLARSIVG